MKYVKLGNSPVVGATKLCHIEGACKAIELNPDTDEIA